MASEDPQLPAREVSPTGRSIAEMYFARHPDETVMDPERALTLVADATVAAVREALLFVDLRLSDDAERGWLMAVCSDCETTIGYAAAGDSQLDLVASASLNHREQKHDLPTALDADVPVMPADSTGMVDEARVDHALRTVITALDYDMHKSLVTDEYTGEDTYAKWVDLFMEAYEAAAPSNG